MKHGVVPLASGSVIKYESTLPHNDTPRGSYHSLYDCASNRRRDNARRLRQCVLLCLYVCRFLKWDDAPCDLDSVGGIRALCEVDMR